MRSCSTGARGHLLAGRGRFRPAFPLFAGWKAGHIRVCRTRGDKRVRHGLKRCRAFAGQIRRGCKGCGFAMAGRAGHPSTLCQPKPPGGGEPAAVHGVQRRGVGMFTLRVTYLMGRVYSAVFDDGDDKREPEWPPHPSRLFSALVAAWGDGGGDEELKSGLEWIGQQGPPTIYAGDGTPRKLVQSFVPVNDAKTLPEDRPRKPRTFPSATLSIPEVYFTWDSTQIGRAHV